MKSVKNLALSLAALCASVAGANEFSDRLNAEIAAKSAQGGGVVTVPAGEHVSGQIELKSNVELHLADGAVILGSDRHEDFPLRHTFRTPSQKDINGWTSLVYAEGATNIAITGKGVIDGRGALQVPKSRIPDAVYDLDGRPRNLLIVSCADVTVRDITLRNPGMWNQHYFDCDRVRVENITVFARSNFNNDGIDIDSSRTVTVRNCRFDTEDDGIVLKTTSLKPCENVLIENCSVSSEAGGFKFGTETLSPIRNVRCRNLKVFPSSVKTPFRHPSNRDFGSSAIELSSMDGAVIENIDIDGVEADYLGCAFYLRVGNRARPLRPDQKGHPAGRMRNVRIANLKATRMENLCASITAFEAGRIEAITLEHINIRAKGGIGADGFIKPSEYKDKPKAFPSPWNQTYLPGKALTTRFVSGLTVNDFKFATDLPDAREERVDLSVADDASLFSAPMALSTVTADAEEQLEELRYFAAEHYRRIAPQTYFLCRSQLKYGLQRVDFLHNWYERPLYQDTTYTNAFVKGQWLNRASWRKQVEVGRLGGLDGFSFFPSTKNRDQAFGASVEPGGEMTILPEMVGSDLKPGAGLKFCERVLSAPNAFKINGKVVITFYPAVSEAQLQAVQALREEIAASPLADKVLLVPYANIFSHATSFEGLNAEKLDLALLEKAKERVRHLFRHTDGFALHFGSCHSARRYNRRLTEDVIIPVMQAVASEEEFRGKKLLGVVYSQGHENTYRWTGIYNSCGTESGRGELEAICRLKPDFAIAGEWDEENENTHFRPTVSNGHVTQRLLRYYSAVANDRPLSVFPGDDITLPNLVLTYRKSLQAGELLDAEVLNIPDGTAPASEWKVSLKWKNLKGETVKEYAPRVLSARECAAVRFQTPVSELVQDPVLVPELTVETSDGVRKFADGFWPVNLEANRNYDYKWVRGALREIARGVSARLQVGAVRPDGTATVTGEVKGPKRFRSIEVLSGPDTVYLSGANMPSTNEVTVRIGLQGFDSTSNLNVQTGSIRIENTRTLRCTAHVQGRLRQQGNGWVFNKMPLRGRFNASGPGEGSFFATIDLASVPNAEVIIDLPPVFQKRIKVADLMNRDGLGFVGPKGAYCWVGRYYGPEHQPAAWNRDGDSFAFTYQLKDPNAVLRIQAVDEDFRIWRGAAYSFAAESGPRTTFHVFEPDTGKVRELSIPASRLVNLDYDFSGTDGAILWGGANRLLPLVPGSTVFPPTFLGMEEGGNQSFPGTCFKDPSVDSVVPQFADEPEGFRSLVFDGHSFLGGGLQMIPQLAGFALEFKLKPEVLDGNRGLIGTGNVGFELSIDQGVPTAFINCWTKQLRGRRNAAEGVTIKGPALVADKWQTLRVVVDQSVAYIEVDGQRGEVIPLSDGRWNPIRANIGFLKAYGEGAAMSAGCFRGRIAAIRIEPR